MLSVALPLRRGSCCYKMQTPFRCSRRWFNNITLLWHHPLKPSNSSSARGGKMKSTKTPCLILGQGRSRELCTIRVWSGAVWGNLLRACVLRIELLFQEGLNSLKWERTRGKSLEWRIDRHLKASLVALWILAVGFQTWIGTGLLTKQQREHTMLEDLCREVTLCIQSTVHTIWTHTDTSVTDIHKLDICILHTFKHTTFSHTYIHACMQTDRHTDIAYIQTDTDIGYIPADMHTRPHTDTKIETNMYADTLSISQWSCHDQKNWRELQICATV